MVLLDRPDATKPAPAKGRRETAWRSAAERIFVGSITLSSIDDTHRPEAVYRSSCIFVASRGPYPGAASGWHGIGSRGGTPGIGKAFQTWLFLSSPVAPCAFLKCRRISSVRLLSASSRQPPNERTPSSGEKAA